ncbi:hypothetical protein NQ318_006296 [Aromia moschata]|uniref:Uncharacterized protein n=1 Tax=Aromia moschata TaxID=1265417 RepID=A0AAV8YWH1_9CUCU|nr:hypothetical protein NQ318_006296 [Aromia moschata]
MLNNVLREFTNRTIKCIEREILFTFYAKNFEELATPELPAAANAPANADHYMYYRIALYVHGKLVTYSDNSTKEEHLVAMIVTFACEFLIPSMTNLRDLISQIT